MFFFFAAKLRGGESKWHVQSISIFCWCLEVLIGFGILLYFSPQDVWRFWAFKLYFPPCHLLFSSFLSAEAQDLEEHRKDISCGCFHLDRELCGEWWIALLDVWMF